MKTNQFIVLALVVDLSMAAAAEPQALSDQQLNFFETKIRPVLVEHCYECHAAGAKIVQGGLRVDHQIGRAHV